MSGIRSEHYLLQHRYREWNDRNTADLIKLANSGQAQDANNIPVEKDQAGRSFDAAACIGCGACVAACPNASAMLFTSAKVSHLALLPQGQVERQKRVLAMVAQMDKDNFGSCSNVKACEAECPKEISVANIARMNREYNSAVFTSDKAM